MRDNVKKKLESNNVNLKKFFVGRGAGWGEKHEGQCQEKVGIQQCEFEEILCGEGGGGGGGRNMRDNVKKKLESNNVNLKKFFGGKGGRGRKKQKSMAQKLKIWNKGLKIWN